ncbi:MAG: hypothetical protein C4518_16310 [Desulfobacteraceae bacterium]|nr:MAG: hypothetical protein C4518_16310 [Desulfobacteraceae bacterium]
MSRVTPAVDKRILIFLAGVMWIGVGIMLLFRSYTWLHDAKVYAAWAFAAIGMAAALVIHHFGFLRIVDKNLGRILPMQGKKCIFSFMTWKSYLLVAGMALMGASLRHSSFPKPYLSILYIGIGMALILSSFRYLRILVSQLRKNQGR